MLASSMIGLTFFLACLLGISTSQQYVWDLLKPALNAAEVQVILEGSRAAEDYPILSEMPASAINFDCASKNQPGFYADVTTDCQVFHRCDMHGNHTSYLCVNTTVFNQITLVCDYFFNVDCNNSPNVEDFANSRLYTDLPLFDTPTDPDYVPVGSAAKYLAGTHTRQSSKAKPNTAASNAKFPRRTHKTKFWPNTF